MLQNVLPMSEFAAVLQAQGCTKTSKILDMTIQHSAEIADLMTVQAEAIPESEIGAFCDNAVEMLECVLDGE
jgi:hypothetical protein